MFDRTRVRGHRIAGPVPARREERHLFLGISAAAWVAIGVAVAAVGAGVTTYAASQQAAAARRQAEAEEEFRMQEAQAKVDSAAFAEHQFRRRALLLAGQQQAQLGALGVDPSSGSPFLLTLDTVKESELEALNIRRGGAVGAYESNFQARLARMRASNVPSDAGIAISGSLNAAASGTSILSSWYRGNRGLNA